MARKTGCSTIKYWIENDIENDIGGAHRWSSLRWCFCTNFSAPRSCTRSTTIETSEMLSSRRQVRTSAHWFPIPPGDPAEVAETYQRERHILPLFRGGPDNTPCEELNASFLVNDFVHPLHAGASVQRTFFIPRMHCVLTRTSARLPIPS
jgi:hypothetical protein